MVLTLNKRRVLRFLATALGEDFSINHLAKECNLTPNGAYKILKKMEKEGILKVKAIANIKSYSLDFENEKTAKILELAFISDPLEGRLKLRAQDIKKLKEVTKACILFGSYITSKQKPSDLDILFIVDKTNYEKYRNMLILIQGITPVKIQDIVQTTDDFMQNFKNKSPIVTAALGKGIVLWGSDVLVDVIKRVAK